MYCAIHCSCWQIFFSFGFRATPTISSRAGAAGRWSLIRRILISGLAGRTRSPVAASSSDCLLEYRFSVSYYAVLPLEGRIRQNTGFQRSQQQRTVVSVVFTS